MKTRYSYGADEHIFVECDEAMSLDAFFKSLSITNAVRKAKIKGVTEICPANASFQVKYNPDVIKPSDMLRELKAIEKTASKGKNAIKTRIIEIPVLYNDPWTHETLMRFRERHQDPKSTDIEYTARINNLDGIDGFIKAHSGAPWFVSMVGFVAGLPFLYQMVDKERQIRRSICVPAPTRRNSRLVMAAVSAASILSAARVVTRCSASHQCRSTTPTRRSNTSRTSCAFSSRAIL
jgi:urea carboxylase